MVCGGGGMEGVMASTTDPLAGGYWPRDDLRRAFVDGAKWWEFYRTGATMWPSDRDQAEAEAERKYPGGRKP